MHHDDDGEEERQPTQTLDEGRYRALLDAVPASLFATTPNHELDFVNRYWSEYSGLSLEETGEVPEPIIHPDDVDRVMKAMQEYLQRGEPFSIEYRARRRNGEYRWHLSHTLPVRDADGKLLGWVGAAIDINDRKRAEEGQAFLLAAGQALSRSLDYDTTLQTLARLSIPYLGDGCEIDLIEGNVLALAAMAHVDPAKEEIARRMRERYPPPIDGPHPAARAVRTGRPVVTEVKAGVLERLTADQEHREMAEMLGVSVSVSVPLVAHGAALGAMTFLRTTPPSFRSDEIEVAMDLGRRAGMAVESARLYRDAQRKSEELRIANATKDELLALVAHELRTPLTTIRGNAELLARRASALTEEERARALNDVRRDAERLQRLMDNMLALSQLEADGIETEPLRLQQVLPRLAVVHQRVAPAREILVEVEPDIPPVLAHATYFDQVVENLLSNAEKYSPPNTPIELTARRESDEALITVADRGSGISEEEAAAVFMPFYRADKAREKAGLGLGLTVCRRLVEAQGGRIWAQPREGGGTLMQFTLPLEPIEDEPS